MLKYYLKHLFRTIIKKPLQPILVVFILTVSFIVTALGLSVTTATKTEFSVRDKEKYGKSEIVMTINSESTSRFFVDKEVSDLLPNADVTGSFALPYLYGTETVPGVAVDVETVGKIFDLTFVDETPLNLYARQSAVYLSKTFAKEKGLSVGDKISFSLFGKEVNYVVYGISLTPFIGDNDVLVDISGIIKILTEKAPSLAVFTDDFKIFSTVYIGGLNGNGIESAYALLNQEFAGYSINIYDESKESFSVEIFQIIGIVMTLLCFVATFAVILSCTYSMTKSRAEFSYLFSVAGVRQKSLLICRALEMAVYALMAILLGTIFAIPLGKKSYENLNIVYCEYEMTVGMFTICALTVLLVSVLPTFVTNKKSVQKPKRKDTELWKLVFPVSFVVLLVVTFLVRIKIRFPFAFVAVLCLFMTIVVYCEPFVKGTARKISKTEKNVPLSLATKNFQKIGELVGSSRLVCILMTIVWSATFLLLAMNHFVGHIDGFLVGDFIMAGGNANAVEILKETDGVDAVYGLYISEHASIGDMKATVWGVEDEKCLSDYNMYTDVPQGNNAYAPTSYAGMYDLQEGDEFEIDFGSHKETFILQKTVDSAGFYFLIDAEAVGEKYSSYIVQGEKNIDKTELYSGIVTELAVQTVSILPMSSVMKSVVKRDMVYLYSCELLLVILTTFGVIGIGNNLLESYRSRKDEFRLYSVAGVSKKNIRKMLTYEYLFTLIFSLLVSLVLAVFMVVAFRNGIISYGADCFRIIAV